MSREVSVRELRNKTTDVIAAVRSGERVVLTVNRQPVADIVPHSEDRSPWIPAHVLREILENAAADPELLEEIRGLRNSSETRDPWGDHE
jgi:prevent-host-death family protein